MISSLNGSAVGDDGTSNSLSNRTDRRILGLIRRQSDVVLVGAATVRAEGYRLPKTAPLAVVTKTGDLTGHRLDEADAEGRVLVLCPESAVGRVEETLDLGAAHLIPIPDAAPGVFATRIVAALRSENLQNIVCEGGPRLAGALIEAAVVDEFSLSTSAVLSDSGMPLLQLDSPVGSAFRLGQLLVDEFSSIYARWYVQPAQERLPETR